MQRVIYFSFLLSFSMPVAAQQQPISNQQIFKTEDGLPQSLVSGIVEDRDGFIWIGTQDGIARYDGRSFKTISRKETGGIGFRSHVITNMAYNQNNHITIVYQGGTMDDFDPVTLAVKRVLTTAKRKPFQTRQGIVGSDVVNNFLNAAYRPGVGKGIDWIDPATGDRVHIGTSNGKLTNDTICALAKDKDSNIIVITPSGVEISRDKGETFRQITFRIPFDSTI
ncbi:MAG: hypothetical protein EOO01_05125, partial [Chitinophagaceae bacterium]